MECMKIVFAGFEHVLVGGTGVHHTEVEPDSTGTAIRVTVSIMLLLLT